MKKLAFVFAAIVAVSFASCGNKAQQTETQEKACVCGETAKCGGECEECTCCPNECESACDTTACEGQCPEECTEAPAAE